MSRDLILYDGVCGLCNRLNQLVIANDAAGRFRFASLQSTYALDVLRKYGRDPRDLDTFYVMIDQNGPAERLLNRGPAIVHVLRSLGGWWRLVGMLRILPRRLLNLGYGLVARNRYRLFGRYETCLRPTPEIRDRFIEV